MRVFFLLPGSPDDATASLGLMRESLFYTNNGRGGIIRPRAGVVPGMLDDEEEEEERERSWAGVVPGMLDDEEEEEERERSWAGVVPEAIDDAAAENARFMSTGAAGRRICKRSHSKFR